MSHTLGPRQLAAREREFQKQALAKREAEQRQDLDQALNLVAAFNSRIAAKRKILLIPTIECALLAGHPWLHVVCRRCECVGAIDLSFRKSNPNRPVTSVVPTFECAMCDGRHPIPRVLKLSPYHEPGRPIDRDRRPGWPRDPGLR
jgi:hypothetical protein